MKFADLFCGCGGLTLGFEKAGLICSVSIDNFNIIQQIHNLNFKHDFILQDLNDIKNTLKILNK